MMPPRWSRALLRLGSPAAHRDDIDGDLTEWFDREAAIDTPRARRAYRRLVWSTLADHARALRRPPDRSHHHESNRSSRSMTDALFFNLRQALRSARAVPLQVAAMALTVALSVGAVTTVAVVVNTTLFIPLSYQDSDRVVFMLGWDSERGQMRFGLPPGDFVNLERDLTGPSQPFVDAEAYRFHDATLTGGAEPVWVRAYRVTPGTFDLLGVTPLLGRAFDKRDVDSGRRPVVMSHGLWRRQFGSAPDIVGRQIVIDDTPHVVAAVMPREFEFPVFNFKGDLWMPFDLDAASLAAGRNAGGSVVVIGRLAPGASLAKAQGTASAVMATAALAAPETNRGLDVRVIPMSELGRSDSRAPLAALFAVMLLLFVAATASVASMVLARGVSRQRELAVRGALGAKRGHIVGLLVWESFLPIAAGGVAGLALAAAALAGLGRLLPADLVAVIPNIDRMRLDGTAVAVALLAVGVTTVVAAILPALRVGRTLPRNSLTTRSGASLPTRRLTTALVVIEVAVSMVLVVASILLARTVVVAANADLGFQPEGLLTFTLSLPAERYGSPEATQAFFDRAESAIAALPGVTSAGGVNVLPFSTSDDRTLLRFEGEAPGGASRPPSVGLRVVTPNYIDTMGLGLVEGRGIDVRDRDGAPLVAVINRSLRALLPADRPAVGARVRFGQSADAPWLTVVGVVNDVRHNAVTELPRAEVYVPLAQRTHRSMTFAVRAAGGVNPETLAPSVTEAIHRVDPAQPVFGIELLTDRVRWSLFAQHLLAWFMGVFAVTAGLVAFVGLYGLVSYSVARQAPEFGVRLALGARPASLRHLVLGRAMRLAAIGGLVGLGGAWAMASLLGAVLIGVAPHDPWAFGGAVLLILAAAAAASAGPARRAARIDPIVALRAQ